MQGVIRLGDKLSSDGEVISVAEGMSFMGRGLCGRQSSLPVARARGERNCRRGCRVHLAGATHGFAWTSL